ncbi:MAG: tetratricopeptide repeat protein [Silvanigrellaceae bacterium]|nr:tetratricopeptide repeat protein [Silvanigrellaceae bacterium]
MFQNDALKASGLFAVSNKKEKITYMNNISNGGTVFNSLTNYISNGLREELTWVSSGNLLLPTYEPTPKFMSSLKESLRKRSIAIISGITGSGKTTLAQAYLYDFLNKDRENRFVFMLNAQDVKSYYEGLYKLAEALVGFHSLNTELASLPVERHIEAIYSVIQKRLSNKAKKWRLVLDNLDEDSAIILDDFEKLIGQFLHGKAIITTQHSILKSEIISLDLSNGIQNKEAESLIKRLLINLSSNFQEQLGAKEDLVHLTKDINRLPLALCLAGHYLVQENLFASQLSRKPRVTIKQYRELLLKETKFIEDKHFELLRDKPGVPKDERGLLKTQHAAVRLSIRKTVKTNNTIDLDLLRFICFCSFLHGNGISQELLIQHISLNYSKLTDSKQYEDQYLRFYGRLASYSLLQPESCEEGKEMTLHIHRCVQDVLRDEFWKQLLQGLSERDLKDLKSVKLEERNKQTEALYSLWIEKEKIDKRALDMLKIHIDSFLGWLEPDILDEPFVEKLKIKLGCYVAEKTWNAFDILKYLNLKRLNTLETTQASEEKIRAYITLADTYLYLNPKKAEDILQKITSYLNQKFEVKDPLTLIYDENFIFARLTLGVVYSEQHRFSEAQIVLKSLVDNLLIKEKYPSYHLQAKERLGRVYYWLEQLAEAHALFEETLLMKRSLYSQNEHEENNRDTAHTLFELGVIFRLQGKYEEALENFNLALIVVKKLFNNEPDLGHAHVLSELGHVAKAQKHYFLAEEHYKHSLSILAKLQEGYVREFEGIAEDYIVLEQFRGWNLHGLGEIAELQSSMEEALKYYHQALDVQQAAYGIYHKDYPADLDIIKTLNSIGRIKLQEKDYEEAGEYLERAESILHALYGVNFSHSVIVENLTLLSQLALTKDESVEAEKKLLTAKAMYSEIQCEKSWLNQAILETQSLIMKSQEDSRSSFNF